MRHALLVAFLCCSVAVAHVVRLHDQHGDGGSLVHADPHTGVVHVSGAEAHVERFGDDMSLPQDHKTKCGYMLCGLCVICCCGGALQGAFGREAASAISMVVSIGMFVYLLHSGIYSAYWKGEHVGTSCIVMCWWAIFQMVMFSCFTCIMCCGLTAAYAIKNAMVQKMRTEYEEKMLLISGPRRDYYESDFFKAKCERYFNEADIDGNGSLDMKELQDVMVRVTQCKEIVHITPLLQEAFEQHGDSVVEKQEFVEMMKFVSVTQLKEGQFTLEQAYEILQLPETAGKAEISKAYRKMAIKYHPDKNTNPDPEVAKRDMAEINDAHSKVQEQLKLNSKDAPV